MATSDERSSQESEESNDIDFYCTPCSQEFITIDAEKYCQNCIQNLCTQCLQQHNKFDSMKEHVLTDRQDTRSIHLESLRYVCKTHPDKSLNVYCHECDQLCCSICAAVDHRCCLFVDYFPRKSKDISSSSEFEGITDTLYQIQNVLEAIEKARELDGQHIDICATNIEEMVVNYREKIIAVLDEIAARVRTENQLRHSKLQDRIQRDIKKIREMLKLIKAELRHAEANSSNDARTYVNMKHAQNTLARAENFIKDMKKSVGKVQLKFEISEDIKSMFESTLSSENPFGHFSKQHMEHDNIWITDVITGFLPVADNIIMATKSPNSAKITDKYHNILDSISLPGVPYKLCMVSMAEVAIALPRSIQFVSIKDKLALTRQIDLDCKPVGIGYIQDQLYFTSRVGFLESRREVMVYDLAGGSYRVLEKCIGGEEVLKYPTDIAIDTENGLIYIADERKGIVILDQEGNHLSTVWHPDLKTMKYLCMGNCGNVFVTCSKSIFKLSPNGEHLTTLLDESYGIKCPTAMCYDEENSRLYVAIETGTLKALDIN